MMESDVPTLELLFEQLGLDGDEVAIAAFVAAHRLSPATALEDAAFWSPAQQQLLSESYLEDANWAPTFDQLNMLLH